MDFGCGWGAIGLIVAKLHPNIQVTLTDTDETAIKISDENIKVNNFSNISTSAPNIIQSNSFDLILSNLPWHKNLSATPVMIQQAFDWLKVSGKFYAVVSKVYRTQDKIEEIFSNVSVIAENQSYKILVATKLTNGIDPLREKVLNQLKSLNITPDFLKDQNFLVSSDYLNKIVETAKLKRSEIILEIGPGLGQITEQLSKHAKKIIALEIDERLKPILNKLPTNVEIIYGNAWNIVGRHMAKVSFDKFVACIPYSFCEPLMHKLAHANVRPIYMVLPKQFVDHLITHQFFSAIFDIEIMFTIPRAYFYPMPKTDSALVYLIRNLEKPNKDNLKRWFCRFIYENEEKTLKNILRLTVEEIYLNINVVKLTKNQAREIVNKLEIDKSVIENDHYNKEIADQLAIAIQLYFDSQTLLK